MTDNDTVSRKAVKKVLKDWYENLIVGSLNGLIKRIDAIPTAEPQIIRCKDCRHYGWTENRIPEEQTWWCYKHDTEMGKNDYCSYAERRQDDSEMIYKSDEIPACCRGLAEEKMGGEQDDS